VERDGDTRADDECVFCTRLPFVGGVDFVETEPASHRDGVDSALRETMPTMSLNNMAQSLYLSMSDPLRSNTIDSASLPYLASEVFSE
jgi:hypothetical protein